MLSRSFLRAIPSNPITKIHPNPQIIRMFSQTSNKAKQLKIGYIPEHFSTPLHFAQTHFALDAHLIPFPTGTGALTAALKNPFSSNEDDESAIDVAIGLTEGFVADLGRSRAQGQEAGYNLVGTYVESPLCWGISVGGKGKDKGLMGVEALKGRRLGVSRIGSGSYVMAHVLADEQGWLEGKGAKPFAEIVPIGDFAALRDAVNEGDRADFFMWEHFTTKHYWDSGELARVGEIYTPWPSWMIAARDAKDSALEELAQKVNEGVGWYRDHPEEAVEFITRTMNYSTEDAKEWMKGVRFAGNVRGVDVGVVKSTVGALKKAGVLGEGAGEAGDMVAIKRAERAREG